MSICYKKSLKEALVQMIEIASKPKRNDEEVDDTEKVDEFEQAFDSFWRRLNRVIDDKISEANKRKH